MGKIKIRRTLFIGLGGTGMTSIVNTKKIFAEAYPGKELPMLGFLGIDTNDKALDDLSVNSKVGKITLDRNEWLPLVVNNPIATYNKQREIYKWLPDDNVDALNRIRSNGAGQIRSNGRFIFTYCEELIKTKVRMMLSNITNARISDEEEYEITNSVPDIHIVFSVCGGTGCGTFIDMAYLLRNVAKDCQIHAYAVLPDVFELQGKFGTGSTMVKANAYGAIQDLDWLMHFNLNTRPITFKYSDSSIYKTGVTDNPQPFDSFVFVDNENENGDTYQEVNQLAEMISLYLFASSGELTHGEGVWDNIQHHIGEMRIKGKNAWIIGIGACEIIFRGEELADYCCNKGAKELINLLLNKSNDEIISDIVAKWIKEVQIEEHKCDDVIDFMWKENDFNPCDDSVVSDKDPNPLDTCKRYIDSEINKEKIEENRLSKQKVVEDSFIQLLKDNIKLKNGIGNVKEIISRISANVEISSSEMEQEIVEKTNELKIFNADLESACGVLNSKIPGILNFNASKTRKQRRQAIADATNNIISTSIEIERRKAASLFFTDFKVSLATQVVKIETIAKRMEIVSQEYCATEIENKERIFANKIADFQIDLAKDKMNECKIDESNIVISDFSKSIESKTSIYDFDSSENKDIYQFIVGYINDLPVVSKFRKMSIDEVIDKMEPDDFKHLVEMSINKSEPLLRKDYGGEKEPKIYDAYYIGVHDVATSRFKRQDYFENQLNSKFGNIPVDFQGIKSEDKVIVYRIFAAIPAFAIKRINSYKPLYDSCQYNCHFDSQLEQRMKDEGYSLYPKDDDDNALEYWVKGFIFGLVGYENGKYFYKDLTNLGLRLKHFKVELSSDRAESFASFKNVLPSIHSSYKDEFDKQFRTLGIEKYSSIIRDIKSDDNYLNNFVYNIITQKTLDSKHYEASNTQVTNEVNFVMNNLKEE